MKANTSSSITLLTILTVVLTMCLSTPRVLANMRFLVSIRSRLERILQENEITTQQYNYITTQLATDIILDEVMLSRNTNINPTPLDTDTKHNFSHYLDQQETNGTMTESTSDLIRNIFDLGAATSRPDEIFTSQIATASYTTTTTGVVELLSRSNTFAGTWEDDATFYNGIWGYTKGMREYALQCSNLGLHILDVTTTDDDDDAGVGVIVVQTILMEGGDIYRDVATHDDGTDSYAYIAAQGGTNPDAYVVNLSQLYSEKEAHGTNTNPITTNNIKNIGETGLGHTINVWNGLLFLNRATYGCKIFDLSSDPMTPEYITTYEDGDCHDSYGQTIGNRDILFSADGSTGQFRILDITNIRSSSSTLAPTISKMGETATISGSYAHQNVVSDDGTKLFVFDEFGRFDIAVYDISDLSNPKLLTTFHWSGDEQTDGNAYPHNGAVFGSNYLLVAYYNAGLRVFDVSDLNSIQEVGYYETYRDPDGDGNFEYGIETTGIVRYDGAWNVAMLQSGKILVSDTRHGTFVFKINAPPTPTPTPAPAPTSTPTTSITGPRPTTANPTTDAPKNAPTIIRGIDFTPQCLIPLQQADIQGDQRLSKDEYATYVNIESNGAINTAYGNLPISLINNFENLSNTVCVRAFDDTNPNCGTNDDGITELDLTDLYASGFSKQRRYYIYEICTDTIMAIRDIITSTTNTPTNAPTITSPTTASPLAPITTPTTSSMPTTKRSKCAKKNKQLLMIKVKTDNESAETEFNIRQRNKKGKWGWMLVDEEDFENSKVNYFFKCVSTKTECYRLKITDSGNNGIQDGFVKMFIDGKRIYNDKFATGRQRRKRFGRCKNNTN